MRYEILILAIVSTLIGSLGALMLKKSNPEINLMRLITNYKLLGGLFLYLVASVVFIYALKFGELSLVYPLTSLTYIWIALISKKYLNEHITLQGWLGICLIILGIVLMGVK